MRYVKADRYRNGKVNLPKISDTGSIHSSNLSGRSHHSETETSDQQFIVRGSSLVKPAPNDSVLPTLFSESAGELADPAAPPMDPAEDISQPEVTHIWTNAISLDRISHGLLIELKRDLKITPVDTEVLYLMNLLSFFPLQKLKFDTLVTYGVSSLPTRDGLIFPRFSQQRNERLPNPSATGMKTVRIVSGSITRGRDISVREEIYPR